MEYIKVSKEPLKHFSQYVYHFHNNYEVYYFLSGDADYLVEGREYHLKKHSLLLLAPNVLHGVRVNSNEEYRRCTMYFDIGDLSPERVSRLLSAFPTHPRNPEQVIFYENLEEYNFEVFFKMLAELEEASEENRAFYRPIYLEAFLARIHTMQKEKFPSMGELNGSVIIQNILKYLNENVAEKVTLDDLAERFHISKYYMNRLFKKEIGTTIMDYVTFKRVILAKQYLLNGEPATVVANKVGFGEYSSFYRAYKKVTGVSPSEYA